MRAAAKRFGHIYIYIAVVQFRARRVPWLIERCLRDSCDARYVVHICQSLLLVGYVACVMIHRRCCLRPATCIARRAATTTTVNHNKNGGETKCLPMCVGLWILRFVSANSVACSVCVCVCLLSGKAVRMVNELRVDFTFIVRILRAREFN